MSALTLIFKILCIILLCVIAMLILISLFPTSLYLYADKERKEAQLRICGIKVKVKPGLVKKLAKTDAESGEEGDNKDEGGAGGISLEGVLPLLANAKGALKYLLRHTRLTDIEIRIPVRGAQPHETGIATGAAWAAFGSLSALLANIFKSVRYGDVDVYCDINGTYSDELKFGCALKAPFGIIFGAAAVFIKQYLSERGEKRNDKQAD